MKSFKNGYSVYLSGSQVIITFNSETIKVIDVNPNLATEQFVEISNKVSGFGISMAA